MTITGASRMMFTRDGLTFDAATHKYTFNGRELVSVTQALKVAGLVDESFYTEEAGARGTRTHAAIRQLHEGIEPTPAYCGDAWPFLKAYRRFLAESRFRVDAAEEPICDPVHGCAGTLDLLGAFPLTSSQLTAVDGVDLIDVKTGSVPSWVGYQTAGYRSMLPPVLARRCRRFSLNLREDGTYRLAELRNRNDEQVFHAAVVIAQARLGWLR